MTNTPCENKTATTVSLHFRAAQPYDGAALCITEEGLRLGLNVIDARLGAVLSGTDESPVEEWCALAEAA